MSRRGLFLVESGDDEATSDGIVELARLPVRIRLWRTRVGGEATFNEVKGNLRKVSLILFRADSM